MASGFDTEADSTGKLTRREWGALVAAVASASPRASAQSTQPTAAAANPGPILDIAEWSYHWYGVEHATLARGTVCNGMQMYVEHWIPASGAQAEVRHPY